MNSSTSSSLTATLAQALTFLTRPLCGPYPSTTVMKLQLILEANLTALYAPSWDIHDPLRGSGRRCLTLAPTGLPPRPFYSACIATGVQWPDWIALLGGHEFDFFVDPGCVSVRYKNPSGTSTLVTVWANEIPSPSPVASFRSTKTLAQQLLEYDNEEDEIFDLIRNEVHGKHWLAPPVNTSIPIRTPSPFSAISAHSRCSSRSSNSSSGLSLSSVETSSPGSSPLSKAHSQEHRQSRRERARQSRIVIDKSKIDVTPYDGGNTTVLTGGVMLGGGATAKATKMINPIDLGSWRAGHA